MASKPHLEALQQLGKNIRITGVYNRSREPAELIAGQLGYRIFDSVDEIADDHETDGVILITPPNQRYDIVKTLADAGKHILTEKPLERSTQSAHKLVEICEIANVKFGVVFQHRFRSGALRLSELVKTGKLGDIALVRAEIPWWRDQSYYDVPGRGSYERDGGGVLISQAIHVLDLLLSLTGPAKSVQAFCATTQLHELESEDFATGGLQFVSGAVGSIVATTATFPGAAESIVIDGTLGTATLRAGHLSVNWRNGETEDLGELSGTGGGADPMAFPCDWHRDLISDFADSIIGDRQPHISGREALKVHALIDAMVQSSNTGKISHVTQTEV